MTTYAYGGDPTGLSGKYHFGSGALGIRGDAIPSTGTQGAGYIYASLSLPTDAASEYYGVITSVPVGLTLDSTELSDFAASAANGTYVVPFDLYEFGVLLGSTSFSLSFGPNVNLTGSNASQTASSGTVNVTVTPPVAGTVNLVGADCSQNATSGVSAVSKTLYLSSFGCYQDATSGTGAITIGAGLAPRYARPNGTVSAGAWLPSAGASLADMIDEPTADSTDYIYTTSPSTCEIALNPVADPGTSSGQVVRYQAWSPDGNGLTVRLKQGATIIAAWSHPSLPTTPTIYAQSLSPSECDSITDYTNLRFEFLGL